MQHNLFSQQQSTDDLITEIDAHRHNLPAKQSFTDNDRIDLENMPIIPERWVIPFFMAKGKVTMLAGDRGIGKTFLTTKIASAISNGEVWYDGTQVRREPLLFINVEDDEAIVKIRLSDHGANWQNINYYNQVTINNPQSSQKTAKGTFKLPRDLPWLDAVIKHYGIGACVIDNVGGCFHNADSNRYVHEEIMLPLVGIMRANDVACLLINHRADKTTRKSDNSASLTNLASSIAHAKSIQDVCRAVFYGYVPDENVNLINIKCTKTNLFSLSTFPPTAYTLHGSIDGRTTCVFLNEAQITQGVHLSSSSSVNNTEMTVYNPCATPELIVKSVVTLVAEHSGITGSQIVQYLGKFTDNQYKIIAGIGKAISDDKIIENHYGNFELSPWVLSQWKAHQQAKLAAQQLSANTLLP